MLSVRPGVRSSGKWGTWRSGEGVDRALQFADNVRYTHMRPEFRERVAAEVAPF
jgi:N-methylhydantoinase B/oxoprolinase/acetone carboxylase alpha subunit